MPNTIAGVIVLALIFSFLIVRMALRHEEKKMSLKAEGAENAGRIEQILAATQGELARLKERVQVLEKLVTDDDRKLADEIERLRGGRGDDIRR